MEAISTICDEVRVIVPIIREPSHSGEVCFTSKKVTIIPIRDIPGRGVVRKLLSIPWFGWYLPKFLKEARAAKGIHVPIPSDVGTFGIVISHVLRKPLFIRHCGNWFKQKTRMEKIWRWYMERFAGGCNLFLTTGGGDMPPAETNPNIEWIFSTTLTQNELNENKTNRNLNPKNKITLITISRQVETKGTGRVLQALSQLSKKYKNIQLLVVGDGPDLGNFKLLSRELGIEHIVEFLGKLNHTDVLHMLKRSDIFCYPTEASEGFPKVVLEAISCGLPVITNPISVLPKLIGDTQSGIIMQKGTPDELARSITKIIEDPKLYLMYSHNACITAENYSLEAWADFIKVRLKKAWKLT